MRTGLLACGVLAAMVGCATAGASTGLPATGSICTYDAATATAQVQMLSARTVLSRGGDQLLADGRSCAPLSATRQVVVASAYPSGTDTVVVDERHGRLAAGANAPTIFALTGSGDDTMEVIGTAGPDRYASYDDLGASIDLNGDGRPDFTSTHVGRVVLRGGPGDDFLLGRRDDVLVGGPGHDRIRRQP
jgi:hypothetical protein